MMIRSPNTAHGRGRPVPPPAWRASQVTGTWVAIPAFNYISDLDPENNPAMNPNYPSSAPWRGAGGQGAVLAAWCGTVYDRVNDRLIMPLGGGHTDYAGNESYWSTSLRGDSVGWTMPRAPSGAIGNTITLSDGQEATGLYSDGRLRAVHSYGNHCFVPGVGPVVTRISASYSSALGRLKKIHKINESDGEAVMIADWSAISNTDAGNVEGCACFDPTRGAQGTIWHCGAATAKMVKTDVATGISTTVGAWGNNALGDGIQMTYCDTHDLVLIAGTNGIRVFDPVTSLWTTAPQIGTTSAGVTTSDYLSGDWNSDLGALVCWNNASNTTEVTLMTPGANPRTDNWTASVFTVDAANTVTPPARINSRTFDRFGYAPNLKGCYLLLGVNQPIYFFATGDI